ncbi:hypothetical protein T484DRAFT_1795982 [Baffinella frigidus]|nr:hypothetical protein T484DRAFT_1795982 [Cryptophyta sp. CCMP2293]
MGHCVVHELKGEEIPPDQAVRIFLMFDRGEIPPDQAVRIFLMFHRGESAMKAVIDLDGRFFGGRNVKAIFFDETKFHMKRFDPEDTE